jgi:hypothetical protein
LRKFNCSALFVDGNYLAVFGTSENLVTGDPFSGTYTIIKIFDISNRAKPF